MSEDFRPLLSECSVIYITRYMTGSEQDGRRTGFPGTISVASVRSHHTLGSRSSIADEMLYDMVTVNHTISKASVQLPRGPCRAALQPLLTREGLHCLPQCHPGFPRGVQGQQPGQSERAGRRLPGTPPSARGGAPPGCLFPYPAQSLRCTNVEGLLFASEVSPVRPQQRCFRAPPLCTVASPPKLHMALVAHAPPVRLIHTFRGCAGSNPQDRSTTALRGRPHPL